MTLFEFIITMSILSISVLGYMLAYKDLRKQLKELKKDKGNEE